MATNQPKIFTTADATENFTEIAKIADQDGQVYLYENGKPKYRLVDVDQNPEIEMTEEEKIDFVTARILREYRGAFEELAK